MNKFLLERSSGLVSPELFARRQTAQRIETFQSTPKVRFNGGEQEVAVAYEEAGLSVPEATEAKIWAHQAGVNALALDGEDKLLLSGGVDSSIKLWDLDECPTDLKHDFKPIATISRTASAHKFGITHLSFYPFDSAAFLSSSYDHHLKLYATEAQVESADFDLKSIIYAHALSPIAQHLLVACATQHPTVRLVDLRSGASTHSLAGHNGALLAIAWSPTLEHVLASGGVDGTIRLWDIRKSSGSLGLLDMEDSVGMSRDDEKAQNAHSRHIGKAHQGAVNGITWVDDGLNIVSAGHDERVRVWDAATRRNTLASFGPTLKNSHLSNLPLIIAPTRSSLAGQEVLFYPSERELLMFQLHRGKLLKRLKVPGPNLASVRSRTGERNIKNRITGLVFRGQSEGIFTAHTDGQIRAWLPRTAEDDRLDKEEEDSRKRNADHEDEDDEARKKRQVLETVFRDLTRQKISFG